MVHQSSSSYICLNDNCSMSEELVNWIIGLHALFICVSCVWIIAICSTFSRPITLGITVLVGFWGIQVSSNFIREVGRVRRAVALALFVWICFDCMILKESRNHFNHDALFSPVLINSYQGVWTSLAYSEQAEPLQGCLKPTTFTIPQSKSSLGGAPDS